MAETPRGHTVILRRARDGDERARGELIALISDELRRAASSLMRRERADHALSPTAAVHAAEIRQRVEFLHGAGARERGEATGPVRRGTESLASPVRGRRARVTRGSPREDRLVAGSRSCSDTRNRKRPGRDIKLPRQNLTELS